LVCQGCLNGQVPCVREVWILNPGPAISYTALQTASHRFNNYASSCTCDALARRLGTVNRNTLRRNMASKIKG